MVVYSNHYDELGELVKVNGYLLVRFSEQETIYKPYLESMWVIIGNL